MSLDFDKFRSCSEEFVSLSTELGDAWIIKTVELNEEDFYLEKRCTVASNCSNLENFSDETNATEDFIVFVYHIIYSHSYSVPVLYFNAYHPNGKLLKLEEIWNKIPGCYQDSIENKWNALSQQEHPKLGIPYFTIHPCHTSDFMSHCQTSNYLISWLSIVGPLVGLNLSCEYAKYLSCTDEEK